jgi:hypothetical protein
MIQSGELRWPLRLRPRSAVWVKTGFYSDECEGDPSGLLPEERCLQVPGEGIESMRFKTYVPYYDMFSSS